MRLGAMMMVLGIVLLIIGAALPATTTESRGTDCRILNGEMVCYDSDTVEKPNPLRGIVLAIGGFVFSGGWGGWIGTYNAERRLKGQLEELGVTIDDGEITD